VCIYDAGCTGRIKSRISMAKAALKKKAVFTRKLGLTFKKETIKV
jgi:hypothetical protein